MSSVSRRALSDFWSRVLPPEVQRGARNSEDQGYIHWFWNNWDSGPGDRKKAWWPCQCSVRCHWFRLLPRTTGQNSCCASFGRSRHTTGLVGDTGQFLCHFACLCEQYTRVSLFHYKLTDLNDQIVETRIHYFVGVGLYFLVGLQPGASGTQLATNLRDHARDLRDLDTTYVTPMEQTMVSSLTTRLRCVKNLRWCESLMWKLASFRHSWNRQSRPFKTRFKAVTAPRWVVERLRVPCFLWRTSKTLCLKYTQLLRFQDFATMVRALISSMHELETKLNNQGADLVKEVREFAQCFDAAFGSFELERSFLQKIAHHHGVQDLVLCMSLWMVVSVWQKSQKVLLKNLHHIKWQSNWWNLTTVWVLRDVSWLLQYLVGLVDSLYHRAKNFVDGIADGVSSQSAARYLLPFFLGLRRRLLVSHSPCVFFSCKTKSGGVAHCMMPWTSLSTPPANHSLTPGWEQVHVCADRKRSLRTQDVFCVLSITRIAQLFVFTFQNSFWFAMGWCLILLIACMVVALVLVSEYRKTDDYEPADNKSFDDPWVSSAHLARSWLDCWTPTGRAAYVPASCGSLWDISLSSPKLLLTILGGRLLFSLRNSKQ